MRAWPIWVSAVLAGCANVGVLESADTLGKGRWEVGAEVGSQAQVGFDSLQLYGVAGVSGRYGVTDRLDVGARLGPSGGELNTKVMLTPRERVVVSVAPFLAGTGSAPSGLLFVFANAGVPVLIGVRLSETVQLVIAPRVHDSLSVLVAGSAGATVNTFFLGLALGVALRLKTFKLIPSVGALAPVATTTWRSDVPSGTVWGDGRWTMQASVAFTFGSARRW